jgi:serine/threonine protein kinase
VEQGPTQRPTLQQQQGDGKYRILKRLAVGGMAEIFLAEAANIHGFRKKVVIKRMLPQYADEQIYIDMFLDEARLVARLNHPSVVQVFDIGEDADGVFFTMEFVEGRDLSEVLGTCYRADRQLGVEEVLAIAIPTAEGLHHAHEARDDHGQLINLIHRDVSPSNVIVTNAGRVKLLDFGVAKSKSQSRETTGVSLKGKFGYMAPEQCEGLAIDRRCDIYSFGVVLWELFTGKRLHGGGNEPQVLVKIMTENPPAPSSMRADLPPELDAIVVKALSRNRDHRYSTMQELLVDLDNFMKKSGTVISSRTLSTMLEDVFAEERPTVIMPVATPAGPPLRSPPLPMPAPPPAQAPGAGVGQQGQAPGSNGGHQGQAPGSNGGHQGHAKAGSNGGHQGHGSGGSQGGHQAQPGSTPSGAHLVGPAAQPNMAMTGPLPAVGSTPTPSHGYATLSPGSQFDQGSVIVPMKSRKGVVAAIVGTVLVLGLGLFLTSTMDESEPAAAEESEEDEATGGAEDQPATPNEPAEMVVDDPPVETQTPEQIAADKKAAAEQAAADKAAADKAAADKAAADKAAADKAAAADAQAAKKLDAAQAAAEQAAAKKKAAEDKAAVKKATASDKAAARKAAADSRAADRAEAAAKRLADRKAAAAKKAAEDARNPKKPKDKKKKPPKWDPNSPFAPQ